MEMSINMAINSKPWLSPIVLDQLAEYVEFKMDFHYVSMRAWKDPEKKWYDLPYLTTDDMNTVILYHCLAECHAASDLTVGSRKFATKRKKEEARLKMEQLVEKRKKEAEEKAKAECTNKN